MGVKAPPRTDLRRRPAAEHGIGSRISGHVWEAGFREVNHSDLTRQVKKTWSVCARLVTRRFFTDPAFRRTLTDPHFKNRAFAKTVFRIGWPIKSAS
jgi:hypothetical protein